MIHLSESSVGLTTTISQSLCEISHLNPIVRQYMREMDNQSNYQRWLYSLRCLNASLSRKGGKEDSKEDGKEDGETINIDGVSMSSSLTSTLLDNPLRLDDTSGENVHDESTTVPKGMECQICERPTTRKCSPCGSGWYCSYQCASHSGSRHTFTCSMGRPLHSADYLHRDCIENEIPEDAEVAEHFGFHRFPLFPDKSKLLGLYQGLFHLDVSPDQLHSWRSEGSLVKNIIETFSKLPERHRGAFFPWFLEHQYCLDSSKTGDEAINDSVNTYFDEARLHLEPEDQNKEVNDLEPPAKRTAFIFLALILHGSHPPRSYTGPYYDFGFCTCLEEHSACRLGGLYQKLLVGKKPNTNFQNNDPNLPSGHHTSCTFAQLWRALEAGKLITLMDRNGFESERRTFPHLDTFLGHTWHEPRSSVWHLQVFLNDEARIEAPNSILIDYGFINCNGRFGQVQQLKSVYRRVLQLADPLALHDACVDGRLFKFARGFVGLEPRLKKLMRNQYPF